MVIVQGSGMGLAPFEKIYPSLKALVAAACGRSGIER